MRITIFTSILSFFLLTSVVSAQQKKPNIVFVIVDQLRPQALGFNGNKDALTPNLDKLAAQSLNLKNAVSGTPVCTPFRASLITGMYPATNGVFMNDVMLDTTLQTLAKVYKSNNYNTGFIGKWHIDGHGRTSFIPDGGRRQGFEYWKTLECTHDYNKSAYYEGNSPKKLFWEGYDAIAQSNDAAGFIKTHAKDKSPFLLVVSLGPPHDPYATAPEKYKAMFTNKKISIPDNVPQEGRDKIEKDLRNYYSHIAALDDCMATIWQSLKDSDIDENTILVFTADHGDMLGSHGLRNKQVPYNESVHVPFLIHYPAKFKVGKTVDVLLNSPDIMPTLLGFTGFAVPATVQGTDISKILLGQKKDNITASLVSCVQPFGQWSRNSGGREYRGVITKKYTYVKDLSGAWLLFDNENDPLQMNNLVNKTEVARIQTMLEKQLMAKLKATNDAFKPGLYYVKKMGYKIDKTETVPYDKMNFDGKLILE
jgi:arylsulfatase A-like enzyme